MIDIEAAKSSFPAISSAEHVGSPKHVVGVFLPIDLSSFYDLIVFQCLGNFYIVFDPDISIISSKNKVLY